MREKENRERRRGERDFEVLQAAGLLEFLLARLQGESRTKIKTMLTRRQILVDGAVVTRFDHPLKTGQWVRIGRATAALAATGLGVKILFEDDYLIVIDKPAGLLSIATAAEKERTAFHVLSRHVKSRSPRNKIFTVHRLDREASGVMLFAKSAAVKEALQADWQNAVHERTYAAVVEGKVDKNEGTLESFIRENEAMSMYTAGRGEEGKQAITHYRVIKRAAGYSLLEVELETGRKNQIRVHMKELGHSIVGDKKYGAKTNPIKRLGLHAHRLGFTHPVTREKLSFSSPIPGSFLGLI